MPTLLLIVGACISGVTFIGLCVVYFRGSADKGTIESQERLIKAQGQEITDLTRRVTVAETRVATVEAANTVLRDAVSHVEEIVRLQQTLDEHHAASIAVLKMIQGAIEGLAA